MICSWCKGTYEECGCGLGHCAHCNNGETTDPPFGPIDPPNILTDAQLNKIWEISDNDIHKVLTNVSLILVGTQVLSTEELESILDYWDDPFRNETVGDVSNRVAWLIQQKTTDQ